MELKLAPEILAYYQKAAELTRLQSGPSQLEFVRTKEVITHWIGRARSVILDVVGYQAHIQHGSQNKDTKYISWTRSQNWLRMRNPFTALVAKMLRVALSGRGCSRFGSKRSISGRGASSRTSLPSSR